MNEHDSLRQEMGDLSYINPIKPVEDPAITLIQEKFGHSFIGLKPKKWTWSKYYSLLFNYYKAGLNGTKNYWDADIQNNSALKLLFETKIPSAWLAKYHMSIDVSGASLAAIMGNFMVVRWLANKDYFSRSKSLIKSAKNGYIDSLKFAIDYTDNETYGKYVIPIIVGLAESGTTHFIEYVYPNDVYKALYRSARIGNINSFKTLLSYPVLKFLGVRGESDYDVFGNFFDPNEEDIDEQYDSEFILTTLLTYCRLDILKWLANKGIIFDSLDANTAAGAGCSNIVEWLYQEYEILPDDLSIIVASGNRYVGVIKKM